MRVSFELKNPFKGFHIQNLAVVLTLVFLTTVVVCVSAYIYYRRHNTLSGWFISPIDQECDYNQTEPHCDSLSLQKEHYIQSPSRTVEM